MKKTVESTIDTRTEEVAASFLDSRMPRIFGYYQDLVADYSDFMKRCLIQERKYSAHYRNFFVPFYSWTEDIAWKVEGELPLHFVEGCIRNLMEASNIYIAIAVPAEPSLKITGEVSPLERIRQGVALAILEAQRYRSQHGSPAENLSRLLKAKMPVEDWQEILDEPYG
jgi:hypothetical protein